MKRTPQQQWKVARIGAGHTIGRAEGRLSPSIAQGATLFVSLQPTPFSTRLPPGLFTAVLSVTLEGQDTSNPRATTTPFTAVLPITVLPWPIKNSAKRERLTKFPVMIPVAEIPTPVLGPSKTLTTVLPFTIPVAAIPIWVAPETRNPSTDRAAEDPAPGKVYPYTET
jgi:hypothetical protein